MKKKALCVTLAGAALLLAACTRNESTNTSNAVSSSGQPAAGPSAQALASPNVPPGPNANAKYGGTLKVGSTAAADTIISMYAHSQGAGNDLPFLYDGLVNTDPDFNIVPWLASSWDISKDAKTYTFHLRHDAKWSDGVPLTSEDVKFEYDLEKNPASSAPYRADLDIVESVSTPDKWTVVYKLKEPNAPFLANVPGSLPHVPLPAHVYKNVPPSQLQHMDFSKHLVTSGGYTLSEWRHDDHFLFKSNKQWWHGRPYIDNIYIKEYQNEQAVQIALQNGDIDTAFALTTPMWLALKDNSRFITIHAPADQFNQYVVNMRNPILADVKVRKAIMYAYDRKTEAEKLFHNEDVVAFSPIPWGQKWAFDPATEKAYPYDPQQAARILDADGWKMGADGYRHKNGQTLAFTTALISGNDVSTKSFELFQANLKAAGIKTDARSYEFNVFFNNEQKGDFDLGAGGFGGGADPDPYIFLHSKSIPPAGLNYGRFSDPKMDRLIDEARRTPDRDKRKQVYYQLQQLYIADVPALIDVMPYYRNVISKRIGGVNPAHAGSTFTGTMYDEPGWYITQ
jgi:peptide/nickel transport system substrate-binding protein